jgi:DNA polymerase III subunit gamma/tau
LASDFARELTEALKGLTDMRWDISFSSEMAQAPLREQELAIEKAARDAILATPIIAAAMSAFPDAELLNDEGSTLQ